MSKSILVTGAAGYIGSVLCQRLLDVGYSVYAMDNLMYRQTSLLHLCGHPKFKFIRSDVRDTAVIKSAVSKVDVVMPLASVVGAPACDRDPWLAKSVNCDALRSLLGALSESQLVIFPTTNSGYGAKGGDLYCTEDTPLEPVSWYGRTKVRAENDVLSRANSISLRLATVFGVSPRMRLDLLVNHFVYYAVTDGYLVIFEKDFKRNFVHIEDVADCFVYCVKHSDRMIGRAFNVGLDDANLSKEELALKIKDHVPNFYIHFAGIGKDPDRRNYVVSNQRLNEVGFEAHRSIDEGINQLIEAYKMFGPSDHRNA